jgi:hypothetical protein
MATWYEIPLIPQAQSFTIQLGGVTYGMRLMYHEANAGITGAPVGADTSAAGAVFDTNALDSWALDISDSTGNPIVFGIPLIPGIDLLYQYQYLGIGGSLMVIVDGDPNGVPDFAGLGTTGHLYFIAEGT